MNFWDKITGNDMKREQKAFDARAKALPPEYQEAWIKIQENLWLYADFTGRSLMPVLDSLLCLLEETAAEGKPASAVLGDDLEAFCAAAAGAEDGAPCRDRWRKQLNTNITEKLKKIGE